MIILIAGINSHTYHHYAIFTMGFTNDIDLLLLDWQQQQINQYTGAIEPKGKCSLCTCYLIIIHGHEPLLVVAAAH